MSKVEQGIIHLIKNKSVRLITSGVIGVTTLVACDKGTPTVTRVPEATPTGLSVRPATSPTEAPAPTPGDLQSIVDKAIKATITAWLPTPTAPLVRPSPTVRSSPTPTRAAAVETPKPERKKGTPVGLGEVYTAKVGDYVAADVRVNGQDVFDKGENAGKTGLIVKLNPGDRVEAPYGAYIQPTDSQAEQDRLIAEDVQSMKNDPGRPAGFRVDIKKSTDEPQPPTTAPSTPIEQPSMVKEVHLLEGGSLNTGNLKSWIVSGDTIINGVPWHDGDDNTALIVTGTAHGVVIETPWGADILFNPSEAEGQALISRARSENPGKRVDVLEYGKDKPQANSPTAQTTPISTSTRTA